MDFYETVSKEILFQKNENCGMILDKAISCFKSGNLNESFHNAASGVLNAKSEHFSVLFCPMRFRTKFYVRKAGILF